VPLPLPLAPAVIVNQLALLVAVHVQPLVVVTVSVAAPPAAVADGLVGETVKAHGAAACVTVTVVPAIVIVPVRDDVNVFAAAV
jgi:hypothetical protein